MGFILNWLLWRRAANKQQEKLDTATEQLGKSEVIADLAERDPEVREALHALGVKTPNDK